MEEAERGDDAIKDEGVQDSADEGAEEAANGREEAANAGGFSEEREMPPMTALVPQTTMARVFRSATKYRRAPMPTPTPSLRSAEATLSGAGAFASGNHATPLSLLEPGSLTPGPPLAGLIRLATLAVARRSAQQASPGDGRSSRTRKALRARAKAC